MHLRNVPVVLAVVLVLAAGWFHGQWTNRWDDSPELDAAVVHLPNIPKTIGPWVGEDIIPTEEQLRVFVRAELRVAVVRSYKHEKTGEQIDIMAVCGPPGPIGTHTPEACYSGAGFVLQVNPKPIEFLATNPGVSKPNTFWSGDFRDGRAITPRGLKVYWAFRPAGAGSRWEASTKPRGEFALYRALYKIYINRPMVMAGPSPIDDNVTPEFIEALLPAIEETVFTPQWPAPASPANAPATAMLP